MLLATWDGTSCVTVGNLDCGEEKFSSVSGIEVRGSSCGTPVMITLGCSNSSAVGLEVGDLVGARLPISMG